MTDSSQVSKKAKVTTFDEFVRLADYSLMDQLNADPDATADEQSTLLAYWTIPFGFIAGVAFSILSGLHTFAWAGEVGNYLISGFLGAASGGLGAFMVGRLVGWTVGSGDAIAYRNRLNQGKYLIIAEGTDELVRQATRILRQYDPENIQGYSLQGSM